MITANLKSRTTGAHASSSAAIIAANVKLIEVLIEDFTKETICYRYRHDGSRAPSGRRGVDIGYQIKSECTRNTRSYCDGLRYNQAAVQTVSFCLYQLLITLYT